VQRLPAGFVILRSRQMGIPAGDAGTALRQRDDVGWASGRRVQGSPWVLELPRAHAGPWPIVEPGFLELTARI